MSLHSKEKINRFTEEYAFLSNFYESPIRHGGLVYATVEHYYQAHKAITRKEHVYIARARSPSEAKKRGRKADLCDGWEQVKVKIMYDGLVYKFTQHPKLKQKLADTEDAMLVEGNWWEDQTWGVYKGRGLNLLGNLLMIVREQI